MDKTYQPHAIETALYQNWEANNYFAPQGAGEPYTIMIPPPNVTGSLHMGHGFNNSIMDALIRFRRMQGRNTLWQPGTDHAGIATQMVVERQLLLKVSAVTTWAAKNSWKKSGNGRNSPAAPSPDRFAASVARWTGRASASPWTTACPNRLKRPLCVCIKTA